MGLFGAIGRAVGAVTEKFDQITNEDELDAVVSAAVMIAYADGKVTDEEKETAFNAIATHEALGSFARDKIRAKFNSDVKLMDGDIQLATGVLEDKLKGLKTTTARIRALGIARQIANADGVFSKEEEAVVNRIRAITA